MKPSPPLPRLAAVALLAFSATATSGQEKKETPEPAPPGQAAGEGQAKPEEAVSVKIGGMLGEDAAPAKKQEKSAGEGDASQGLIDLSDAQQRTMRDLLVKVDHLLTERNFSEAEKLLKEAEATGATHPAVMNARGAYYAEIGEFEKARDVYRAIKDVRPDSFLAQFNLIEIDMMDKQFEKARNGFLDLLKSFPTSDLLHFKIFQSYLSEKNGEGVTQWIRNMELLPPSAAIYYARAATAYSLADFDTAKQQIATSIRFFPADNHRYFQRVLSELGFLYLGDTGGAN